MEIKAIETRYKGYRFRSRLEARYAVFLDSLGIAYLYEEQGFQLPSGKYLPDFHLAQLGLWMEVKPFAATELELHLAKELWEATEEPVIVVQGQPWPNEYFVTAFLRPDSDHFFEPPNWQLAPCRRCNGLVLIGGDGYEGFQYDLGYHTCGDHDRYSSPPILAYEAARSSRFEFGESGPPHPPIVHDRRPLSSARQAEADRVIGRSVNQDVQDRKEKALRDLGLDQKGGHA